MKMNSKSINFKKLYSRLICFFDKRGVLEYERVDVQNIPKKQYFLAVCVKGADMKTLESPYDIPEKFQPVFYFSTQNLKTGVSTRSKLYEEWINVFIKQNHKNAIEYGEMYPAILRSLDAMNASSLSLKLGIIGA